MPDKRVDELVKTIRSWDGWELRSTKNAWVAVPPDPSLPAVNFHKTPSPRKRWYENTIARLRASGAPF